MATTIVNGNRAFAQPGIDGGEFAAPVPITNVLVVSRLFRVESFVISQASVGDQVDSGTAVEPRFSRFNTLQSSGAFIPSGQLVAGQSYDWIAVGLGG